MPEGKTLSAWVDRHVNLGTDDMAPTLCAKYGTGGNNMPCVVSEGFMYENHPQDSRVLEARGGLSPTLNSMMGCGGGNVPFVREESGSEDAMEEQKEKKYVVRRITPRECERLQGFPNKGQTGPMGNILERDYTDIPWPRSKDGHSPDSARYKALGNSMAVPCVRWIAERLLWALDHPIGDDE